MNREETFKNDASDSDPLPPTHAQPHPHLSVHTAYIIFHHNGPICIRSIINCLPLTRMYDWENLLCNQHPACNVVSANEAPWIRIGHLTSPGKPTFQPGLQCNLLRESLCRLIHSCNLPYNQEQAGNDMPHCHLITSDDSVISLRHTREQQEGRRWGGVAWPPWSLTEDQRRCQIRCPLRPTPSLPHATT